jgi:protein ImuA
MPAASATSLDQLRRVVATIDPDRTSRLGEGWGSLPFGVRAVDAALGSGLALGALHEFAPAGAFHLGAACGFALALAARAQAADQLGYAARHVLSIQTDFAAHEAGSLYGPGLDLFGLPMERLLNLRVAHPLDALWAFEEALKCPALAATVLELPGTGAAADLTATRRLSLAAQAGGALGLLIRQQFSSEPSAAMTRWQVAAAASTPDRFGGLGRIALDLALTRNRRGRGGRWTLHWNHDERTFIPEALSLGVAAAARDRSDFARPLAHAAR